jgi:hypothetical protein
MINQKEQLRKRGISCGTILAKEDMQKEEIDGLQT